MRSSCVACPDIAALRPENLRRSCSADIYENRVASSCFSISSREVTAIPATAEEIFVFLSDLLLSVGSEVTRTTSEISIEKIIISTSLISARWLVSIY